jgi:hypothetical protein
MNIYADWNNATDGISLYNGQFEASWGIRFGKISLTTSTDAPTINLAQ